LDNFLISCGKLALTDVALSTPLKLIDLQSRSKKMAKSASDCNQVELELLRALLASEDICYPWNPVDPATEDYFADLEQQLSKDELLDEELTAGATAFYNHLDNLWSNLPSTQDSSKLQAKLASFTDRVPQLLVDTIANHAVSLWDSQQSMADQLVQCVQGFLSSQWGKDDLLTLARPYAYAMRGQERDIHVESILNMVNKDWTDLSKVDQAKVSLAIAQYALAQLTHEN
jgi:hypothetical protein